MSGNEIHSYALGIATQNSNNEIIEVFILNLYLVLLQNLLA